MAHLYHVEAKMLSHFKKTDKNQFVLKMSKTLQLCSKVVGTKLQKTIPSFSKEICQIISSYLYKKLKCDDKIIYNMNEYKIVSQFNDNISRDNKIVFHEDVNENNRILYKEHKKIREIRFFTKDEWDDPEDADDQCIEYITYNNDNKQFCHVFSDTHDKHTRKKYFSKQFQQKKNDNTKNNMNLISYHKKKLEFKIPEYHLLSNLEILMKNKYKMFNFLMTLLLVLVSSFLTPTYISILFVTIVSMFLINIALIYDSVFSDDVIKSQIFRNSNVTKQVITFGDEKLVSLFSNDNLKFYDKQQLYYSGKLLAQKWIHCENDNAKQIEYEIYNHDDSGMYFMLDLNDGDILLGQTFS
jgi:hypothetical protein